MPTSPVAILDYSSAIARAGGERCFDLDQDNGHIAIRLKLN
jgi:hypothetical protein